MLAELTIEDYALIERVHLRLGAGFNVLTGETGTGKSIIIDAVDLVLGARASRAVIRTGCERAYIEAVFTLPAENPIHEQLAQLGYPADEGGMIVISREIARDDRNIGRINGRAATVADIRLLAGQLVDLHGQGEHQLLLRPGHQRQALDRYGGEPVRQALAAVEEAYEALADIRARQAELVGRDDRDRARQLDLLQFQLREIDEAQLAPGEDEQLQAERRRLAHAEECRSAAAAAAAAILGSGMDDGVTDRVLPILKELERAAGFDGQLSGLTERLEGLIYELEDAGRELRRYHDKVEVDEERLQIIAGRLETIRRLTRKYGDDVEAVLAFGQDVAAELDRLVSGEERARELAQEHEQVLARWADAAVELAARRREVADQLAAAMEETLAELGMAGGVFEVAVTRREAAAEYGGAVVMPDDGRHVTPARHGADDVVFHFSANAGEPAAPLARVASGGETARLMLALKSILAGHDDVATLIFDEIETGIGGRVVHAVAASLAAIANGRQVVSVTHLAAVAAVAQQHFMIEKVVHDGRTVTHVLAARDEERVHELARMIGGNNEAIGLEHARSLLKSAASRA